MYSVISDAERFKDYDLNLRAPFQPVSQRTRRSLPILPWSATPAASLSAHVKGLVQIAAPLDRRGSRTRIASSVLELGLAAVIYAALFLAWWGLVHSALRMAAISAPFAVCVDLVACGRGRAQSAVPGTCETRHFAGYHPGSL
jgi:hypothetical protein